MPAGVGRVIRNISAYMVANPDADVVAAAQTAIWLAQGVSLRAIESRFAVTPQDVALARQFGM
jgi:hypothetical protein